MDNTTTTTKSTQEEQSQLYPLLTHQTSTIVFETTTTEEAVTAFFNIDIAIIFSELNAIHNTIQRMRGEMLQLKAERNALAEQVAAQKARIAELEMEVEGANSSL